MQYDRGMFCGLLDVELDRSGACRDRGVEGGQCIFGRSGTIAAVCYDQNNGTIFQVGGSLHPV